MKYLALALLFVNCACQEQQNLKAKNWKDGEARTIVSITTTVTNRVDLPECDASSQDVAAYVVPSNHFIKCNQGRWRRVKPGDTANNYLPRAAIRFYEWEDSVAKKRWSIPSEKAVAVEDLMRSGCRAGWRLPSKDELLTASSNGLLAGIRSRGGRSFDSAWTSDFEIVGLGAAQVEDGTQGRKKEAGLYCVSYASNS